MTDVCTGSSSEGSSECFSVALFWLCCLVTKQHNPSANPNPLAHSTRHGNRFQRVSLLIVEGTMRRNGSLADLATPGVGSSQTVLGEGYQRIDKLPVVAGCCHSSICTPPHTRCTITSKYPTLRFTLSPPRCTAAC